MFEMQNEIIEIKRIKNRKVKRARKKTKKITRKKKLIKKNQDIIHEFADLVKNDEQENLPIIDKPENGKQRGELSERSVWERSGRSQKKFGSAIGSGGGKHTADVLEILHKNRTSDNNNNTDLA